MLQSCGVITHARYGNGYKLNIGNTWGKGEGKTDYNNSSKKSAAYDPVKYRNSNTLSIVKNPVSYNENSEVKPIESSDIESMDIDTIFQKKTSKQKAFIYDSIGALDLRSNEEIEQPVDPYINTASYLFFPSLLIMLMLIVSGGLIQMAAIGLIMFIVYCSTAILSIIGLVNIHVRKKPYRGTGLAIGILLGFLIFLAAMIIMISLFYSVQ